MEALRRGALDVIKKPDPNADEIKAATAIQQAGDNALRNRAPEIAEKLSDAIRKSHWWWRHRGAVVSAIVAFLLGYFASILANVSPALLKLFHLH